MASIQPHGAGFRVHYTHDGAKRKSRTFPTEAAAALWITENLAVQTAQNWYRVIETWRDEQRTPYREEVARRLGAVVAARGWGRPDRLTRADLHAWAQADPAHRQPARYLSSVLHWLADDKAVPIRTEVLDWRPAKAPRKPPQALLHDVQVQLIRDCAASYGLRAYAVVDYLLSYGARPITACRLQQQHLDLGTGELVLPNEKHSGGWRHVLTREHIDRWQALALSDDPSGPLFPHYREDRPWRLAGGRGSELVWWYRNTIAKKLKLGTMAGIYHLKRWAITRMLRANVDPATVALFTGHMDLSQVMRYAKSNAELQTQALAKIAAFGSSLAGSQVPKQSS